MSRRGDWARGLGRMSAVKFSEEEGVCETGLEGLYDLISNLKRITTSLEALPRKQTNFEILT